MAKCVPKPEVSERENKGIGGRRGGKSAKSSGTYFENQTASYFNNEVSTAKRIIGSGAFGKILRDPNLLGDVKINFPVLRQDILADCKFGYSRGTKQLSIHQEWFEKIGLEAELTGRYPSVIVKFKGTRGPNSRVICFTWQTFTDMMKELTELVQNLEEPYKED